MQFKNSPLSQYSKTDLITAKKIWKALKVSHSKVFIFAFGGAGSYSKILKNLFPSKNEDIFFNRYLK